MASQNNRTNYSALPWYTSLLYQNHAVQQRLGYGNGAVWPLISKKGFLPPFQIIRTSNTGQPITVCKIVSVDTGAETDILANITTAGLLSIPYSTYDIIRYPSTVTMAGILQTEGQYYSVLSDGTNTWYSEIFYIKSDLSRCVKLSFWHDEGFDIPIGHITYGEPFANYFYLDTIINNPSYPFDDEVNDVDGYEFPVYLVSTKIFTMYVQVPEFMVDMLRLVKHHHYKIVEFDGITYYPVRWGIDIKEPTPQKHLYGVTMEFAPDTTVQSTGKIKPETEGFAYDQSAYDDAYK